METILVHEKLQSILDLTNWNELMSGIDNEGTLDKEATYYNDIFDAYRLVLQNYDCCC
ncbi:MAG: hypothetical protein WCF23_07590 [Candidatus Nitrosopolaris sp.]